MLNKDPEQRIALIDVIHHPWLLKVERYSENSLNLDSPIECLTEQHNSQDSFNLRCDSVNCAKSYAESELMKFHDNRKEQNTSVETRV